MRRGNGGRKAIDRLGMGCGIERRDFLNGVALSIGAALVGGILPGVLAAPAKAANPAAQDLPGYYPPRLTGLRGSHPGSFEPAHALRDGETPAAPKEPADEHYDLVIVGGGISGLSAAYFYRQRKPSARILILDNHDDFGGHAKRNEFELDGRLNLMNGGTLLIDSPRPYGPVAAGLFRELGIDAAVLEKRHAQPKFYPSLGMGAAVFFDRETFGADQLAVGVGSKPWAKLLKTAPLSEAAKRDIARLEEAKVDYMPGLSSDQKKTKLARMSYREFLLDIAKVDPSVLPVYNAKPHHEFGIGIDAVSALDLWGLGFPGFQGMGLKPGSAPHMGYTAGGYADGGSPTFHFPDGNASVARLLVRALIPDALPGASVTDVVTARVDYAKLDRPENPVRLRLSSIVTSARNLGGASQSEGVELVYLRQGEARAVTASACVMACYNMIIPYLCPDLPEAQKEALRSIVKTPLVYTTVALRNWQAFKALGISEVYAPGSYFSSFRLNPTVDIGGYRSARSPDEPILLFMVRTPCQPGLPERDQHRAGRAELLATSFETFEEKIRDQLQRTLGPGGFDAARDITGITVNRWPHGYAYEYNVLFDPDLPEDKRPHVIGRQRFGRIVIANSDSGAAAYTDSAINQAHRAVSELLAG
jgi:spermidine dehydrogenase